MAILKRYSVWELAGFQKRNVERACKVTDGGEPFTDGDIRAIQKNPASEFLSDNPERLTVIGVVRNHDSLIKMASETVQEQKTGERDIGSRFLPNEDHPRCLFAIAGFDENTFSLGSLEPAFNDVHVSMKPQCPNINILP